MQNSEVQRKGFLILLFAILFALLDWTSNFSSFMYQWTEHNARIWIPSRLGPVSISEKTSYHKISLSLEAARFVLKIIWSFWNFTGTSAVVLPSRLSNFKVMRWFKLPILRLRDFTRSHDKTTYRILKRSPGGCIWDTNLVPCRFVKRLVFLL